MAPNPPDFLKHLQTQRYHPRSNKHSDALSAAVVKDLLGLCPQIARQASAGSLVYSLNFTIQPGSSDWNVDLVLGEAPPGTQPPEPGLAIRQTLPSRVRIAIEHKAVMTEHRKAIRNRKRDFEAHHDHVHRYDPRAIAGGILLINAAESFRSPLRSETTIHKRPGELVKLCVDQLRAVSERTSATGSGLDAKAALVVDVDNEHPEKFAFVSRRPAPSVGDPLHYDSFLQVICDRYTREFAP